MNRKQLIIVIVIGAVLGGIGLRLNRQKSESFNSTQKIASDKLLGDFPVNEVTHITVRQYTNEVNLTKADSWTVKERGDYPANTATIIEFARKLWDLRAAQSQKIGASQLGRMELLPPGAGATNSATLVELKGKDGKVIRSILLGKKSTRSGGDEFGGGGGFPNGRWVYLPDRTNTVYLISEAFNDIEPQPANWLNKDFFKVEEIRSVVVTFPEPTNSWKFSRETESDEWKLADAKPDENVDTTKTSSLSHALSAPSFDDVLVGTPALEKPTVIELETFDGFTYAIKVGEKTENSHPLTVAVSAKIASQRTPGEGEKTEDKEKLDKEFADKHKALEEKLKKEKAFEKSAYLVSSWTVDSLLKPRHEFMAEKQGAVPAQGTTEPTPAAEGSSQPQ